MPYREVDIVLGVMHKSVDTLRERWNLNADGVSPEEMYRKVSKQSTGWLKQSSLCSPRRSVTADVVPQQ